jgi:hypothetical protein
MKKYLLPTLVFLVATALALYNISGFPKMIGDEGIYVSQAYWLTHLGALGPYTYWYDHFPLGWAQIGAWQLLTGPVRFLGHSVLSARALMGLVLGGTTTLLYLLTKQLTKSRLTSFLASFIFITSTLTLTFGRMVLLDNLAVFWFLLSLVILLNHPRKISHLALSNLTLGISILTTESLLFFLPPYLYLTYYLNKDNLHRNYALLISYVTIFFLISFFPLLAILKHELLPHPGQVSLLETIMFQASRGSGIPFWDPDSHFRLMLNTWMKIDPLLLILGSGSTLLSLSLPLPVVQKIISVFAVFFLAFLLRGGQIYEFYLIPLIPFFALNLSFILRYFHKLAKSHLVTIITLTSIVGYLLTTNLYPFYSTATSTQKQSINALKSLTPGSIIVANNYAYLDLYLQGKSQIHWYQKVESDPAVRQSVGKITHILTDFQFDNEITGNQLPYLESFLKSQKPTTKFGVLPAPGQNIKPYTNEFLSLYTLQANNNQVKSILTPSTIDSNNLASLANNHPFAIMITRDNFSSSIDLQTKINIIKTTLPTTEILISQDSEGHNTIPWINTNARSFFKSASEAMEASSRKATALQVLGFTGAIVATSQDQDGYLQSIVEATTPSITPYIRYTNTIPAFSTNLIVENSTDLEAIKKSGYPGSLFLLSQSQ